MKNEEVTGLQGRTDSECSPWREQCMKRLCGSVKEPARESERAPLSGAGRAGEARCGTCLPWSLIGQVKCLSFS